jgi:hypothetical protein
VVESSFAAVRLRRTAGKHDKRVESATVLIRKLLQVAEGPFQQLNALELLPLVYGRVQFVDALQQPITLTEAVA